MSFRKGLQILTVMVMAATFVGACSGCDNGESIDVDDQAQREAIQQAADDLDRQVDERFDKATEVIDEAIDEATPAPTEDDQAAAE